MQLRYKTRRDSESRPAPTGRASRNQTDECARSLPVLSLIQAESFSRDMDFILPSTMSAGGIPWEKVLPPLIPRLNGIYGHSSLSPTSLIPEADISSSPEVHCDDSAFTVQVDVKHFKPEDLLVKVVGDFVEVQGKHEEKKDSPGFTTRQFNRRYRIPKGVDTMALQSAVSPDGILIISAPVLQTEKTKPLT
ncbi:heat shock protein beta-6 isoform X2 [Cololabis saira]|uniref:heat shock protein beta-6 isoform X2 n=1 Tax=Cololabis saira TaxID=129043 RepID=UPI002AD3DE4A|nr:heat shock protein beta-6 isoform X2 [Cololabis saira]